MTDPHIDADSVSSVAGEVETIADAMPDAVGSAVGEIEELMSGAGMEFGCRGSAARGG